jgi:putative endonuclease
MFYVYFLKSLKNGDLHVGSTEDVEKRLSLHNAGKVKSTQFCKPWKLLEYHEFSSRSEAFQKEMFYKTGQQKEILRKRYMAE